MAQIASKILDFIPKSSYGYKDLLRCAKGKLFGNENGRLPAPGMLMFDQISTINSDGGNYGKGEIIAELDIKPDLWFFNCHFINDPVMPGCLGLDAMWQLIGFFLCWKGNPGRGRALGASGIKFTGQVQPTASKVTYHIHIKRLIERALVMGIGNGFMSVDGRLVYEAQDLRVGLFTSTENF